MVYSHLSHAIWIPRLKLWCLPQLKGL